MVSRALDGGDRPIHTADDMEVFAAGDHALYIHDLGKLVTITY